MELLEHEAYNLPEPREGESPAPDPDAGKHAFEVFCDCITLDEQLVAYLIDVLKRQDRTAFYKLSQVTTHLDLDPREFLYWLSHREDYGSTDERACALIMDACFTRLYEEQQGELLGALLSGDRQTFELFRTEAPELRQVPTIVLLYRIPTVPQQYGTEYLFSGSNCLDCSRYCLPIFFRFGILSKLISESRSFSIIRWII